MVNTTAHSHENLDSIDSLPESGKFGNDITI
jgi:hypothetical protein